MNNRKVLYNQETPLIYIKTPLITQCPNCGQIIGKNLHCNLLHKGRTDWESCVCCHRVFSRTDGLMYDISLKKEKIVHEMIKDFDKISLL